MARGLNKVMLIGNLGADPEVRYTSSGQAVATFRVATSHYRRGANDEREEITEWHRIVAWERLAELASEYLRKGRQVYVEGRLQTRQWTDQQGQQRYTAEIVANDITLLGSRPEGDGDDWAETTKPARPQRTQQASSATFGPAESDEVPF